MRYSLSVCQAHWCETCPSQWGLPASPSLSWWVFLPIMPSASSLHSLLLLNFSSLCCLVVGQPCHVFFFILFSTHTHTHFQLILCFKILFGVFIYSLYSSTIVVGISLRERCVYHNRWWSVATYCIAVAIFTTSSQAEFK